MVEPHERLTVPDGFHLINDPNTGHHDAIAEIWQLGEHGKEITRAVAKITELNGGVFGPPLKHDRYVKNAHSLITMFSLIAPLIPKLPDNAQFITVGQESSCAVRVSYDQPYDTPPDTHPGINRPLTELIGARYITLRCRQLRSESR